MVVTLLPTNKDGVVRPEPEEIMMRKMTKKEGMTVTKVVVKWKVWEQRKHCGL